jgi:hypothetical protein
MNFQPKTEKELAEEFIIPEGEYDFEVVDAAPKKSKAGNDMIELKLKVFQNADRGIFVTDYLMEAVMFKLKHFCDEAGLQDIYENGSLTPQDCKGRGGVVQIFTQKDKDGKYPDKSAVKDYGPKKKKEEKKAEKAKPAPQADPEPSDDVPF